ncbi:MAG: hypothetical protein PHX14_08505 [Syntrophomonadaceae bacterium]|nr:hypothetical protein [Syntrophomonadaceae bacterium]
MNDENLKNFFAVSESTNEKLWDMWLATMGNMSGTQEQVENMLRRYLEQRKTVREETIKLVEEMMAQARNNQQQIQKMMQEALAVTLKK